MSTYHGHNDLLEGGEAAVDVVDVEGVDGANGAFVPREEQFGVSVHEDGEQLALADIELEGSSRVARSSRFSAKAISSGVGLTRPAFEITLSSLLVEVKRRSRRLRWRCARERRTKRRHG